METFECCNILKNYLLDSKKNLIENTKKEEFLQKITPGDNLGEFREVFQIVLKNVEVIKRNRNISGLSDENKMKIMAFKITFVMVLFVLGERTQSIS